MANLDLEIKVIRKFVDKAKRSRYTQFVSSEKNRRKFAEDLPHFNHFDYSLLTPVKGIEEEIIMQTTKQNGVSNETCYIISEDRALDTKTLNTREAIAATVGRGMGTILVFGDAEMIFFEGESPNTRFISKKIS